MKNEVVTTVVVVTEKLLHTCYTTTKHVLTHAEGSQGLVCFTMLRCVFNGVEKPQCQRWNSERVIKSVKSSKRIHLSVLTCVGVAWLKFFCSKILPQLYRHVMEVLTAFAKVLPIFSSCFSKRSEVSPRF